ncbi:type I-C CRISPR-associated endonuclease Cas1c [Schleiferilactobacillus shenzhenensis]|nr:type I-C CRISPR-associated endonuclease Cas1c [Schleiferilactobacillus shenzhenensis]
MKPLLNTLFVNTPDAYLSLDGGNVAVSVDYQSLGKVPLINIDSIICFARSGASPALMSCCIDQNKPMTFLTPSGRFLGTVVGAVNGNVVLRKQQYRISDDAALAGEFSRNFIIGKLFNQRWMVERYIRDHALVIDTQRFKNLSQALFSAIEELRETSDIDTIRGIEGNAAANYFAHFDDFILQKGSGFSFSERSRRPPLDRTNALLSFAYSLLANDCAAALLSVGLDPYVGFMHQDRPGRQSLALDLMEELRGVFADRFVLKLINKQMLDKQDFLEQESGAVMLTDKGRKVFLDQWTAKKQETLTHPFLQEKIVWGLVPFVQALLLARSVRGDLDSYPAFLWK